MTNLINNAADATGTEPGIVSEDQSMPSKKGEPSPQTGTVLIADDENSVLMVSKLIVEQLGYHVLTATNGEEAVDVFRNQSDEIGCVLLDLRMPKMNGDEALREMRKINPELKAILTSGFPPSAVLIEFYKAKIDLFIQKPFSIEELTAAFKTIM